MKIYLALIYHGCLRIFPESRCIRFLFLACLLSIVLYLNYFKLNFSLSTSLIVVCLRFISMQRDVYEHNIEIWAWYAQSRPSQWQRNYCANLPVGNTKKMSMSVDCLLFQIVNADFKLMNFSAYAHKHLCIWRDTFLQRIRSKTSIYMERHIPSTENTSFRCLEFHDALITGLSTTLTGWAKFGIEKHYQELSPPIYIA